MQNLYKKIINNEKFITKKEEFKNGKFKFEREKIESTGLYLYELPKSIRKQVKQTHPKSIGTQVKNKIEIEKNRFEDILYKDINIEVITELKKIIFENKNIKQFEIFDKYIIKQTDRRKEKSAENLKEKIKKYKSPKELQERLTQERNRLQNFEIDIYSEIVNFINRFLPNEYKLGKSDNRNVRMLLKGFSNKENYSYNKIISKKEHKLISFLRSNDIINKHKFKLQEMITSSKKVEVLLKEVIWQNIKWCNGINTNKQDDLKHAQEIFKIKNNSVNYSDTDNIYRLFFNNSAVPRGFIKKRFYKNSKSVNTIINKYKQEYEVADFYKYAKEYKKRDDINTKGKIISEQKAKDKVLLLMLHKIYEEKITKLTGKNISVKANKSNLLNTDKKIAIHINNKENKKIMLFSYNNYHKILPILNDKRTFDLIFNCFKEEKIEFEDIDKENMRIDKEQFEIVNKVLEVEQSIYGELTKVLQVFV